MYLQRFGSITSWEAIKEFGATRLSAIILVLRNEGYNITTTMKSGKNRFGENTRYGVYELKEKRNEL